jgi:hypothetical protein
MGVAANPKSARERTPPRAPPELPRGGDIRERFDRLSGSVLRPTSPKHAETLALTRQEQGSEAGANAIRQRPLSRRRRAGMARKPLKVTVRQRERAPRMARVVAGGTAFGKRQEHKAIK